MHPPAESVQPQPHPTGMEVWFHIGCMIRQLYRNRNIPQFQFVNRNGDIGYSGKRHCRNLSVRALLIGFRTWEIIQRMFKLRKQLVCVYDEQKNKKYFYPAMFCLHRFYFIIFTPNILLSTTILNVYSPGWKPYKGIFA